MDCVRRSKTTVLLIIETENMMAMDSKSLSSIFLGENVHLDVEVNTEQKTLQRLPNYWIQKETLKVVQLLAIFIVFYRQIPRRKEHWNTNHLLPWQSNNHPHRTPFTSPT